MLGSTFFAPLRQLSQRLCDQRPRPMGEAVEAPCLSVFSVCKPAISEAGIANTAGAHAHENFRQVRT